MGTEKRITSKSPIKRLSRADREQLIQLGIERQREKEVKEKKKRDARKQRFEAALAEKLSQDIPAGFVQIDNYAETAKNPLKLLLKYHRMHPTFELRVVPHYADHGWYYSDPDEPMELSIDLHRWHVYGRDTGKPTICPVELHTCQECGHRKYVEVAQISVPSTMKLHENAN